MLQLIYVASNGALHPSLHGARLRLSLQLKAIVMKYGSTPYMRMVLEKTQRCYESSSLVGKRMH